MANPNPREEPFGRFISKVGIWLKFVSKTNAGCKRETSHSQSICNKLYLKRVATWKYNSTWGSSSNGRAPVSHAGGNGIDARLLQQTWDLFSRKYLQKQKSTCSYWTYDLITNSFNFSQRSSTLTIVELQSRIVSCVCVNFGLYSCQFCFVLSSLPFFTELRGILDF